MKKIISLLGLLLPLLAYAATPSASSVVDKTVENIRKAPSISANLNIRTASGVTTGTVILSGNRFVFDNEMGSTWYDGKTMWAYSPSTNEVTVTEPTDSELAEINPFEFIKSARTDYTPRLLKSTKDSYTVELKPKKKQAMTEAVVTVDATTYNIRKIVLTMNKQKVDITLSGVRKGKNLPDADFRFRQQLLPKAEINDLR